MTLSYHKYCQQSHASLATCLCDTVTCLKRSDSRFSASMIVLTSGQHFFLGEFVALGSHPDICYEAFSADVYRYHLLYTQKTTKKVKVTMKVNHAYSARLRPGSTKSPEALRLNRIHTRGCHGSNRGSCDFRLYN